MTTATITTTAMITAAITTIAMTTAAITTITMTTATLKTIMIIAAITIIVMTVGAGLSKAAGRRSHIPVGAMGLPRLHTACRGAGQWWTPRTYM
jgi:hypothetical protein